MKLRIGIKTIMPIMFTGRDTKMGMVMDMRMALMVDMKEQLNNMPENHISMVINHGLTTAGT